MKNIFNCDKCGECCRHLDRLDTHKELDSGNGVCIYLKNNICSIYENRPIFCNVDEYYELFCKEKISKEEYYHINNQVCKMLKKQEI